jgi:hypothetical protein
MPLNIDIVFEESPQSFRAPAIWHHFEIPKESFSTKMTSRRVAHMHSAWMAHVKSHPESNGWHTG